MPLLVDVNKLVEYFKQGEEECAASEEYCCAEIFGICANALQKVLDDNNDHKK